MISYFIPKADKVSYSTAFTKYIGSEAKLLLLWRLSPSQLKVLKPHLLLPCEENGVGMFRVFLDRNSDGEFAVGQNTRKIPTSSFMSTSGSPFSAGEDPGKLFGQLLLPERRAPLLSACVLAGNIQQHIFTLTVFKQRTSEAMSPAPDSPSGISPSCTRSRFAPPFHSLGPKGLRCGSGGGAGRCSGSARSCPGAALAGGGAGDAPEGRHRPRCRSLQGRTGSSSPAGGWTGPREPAWP